MNEKDPATALSRQGIGIIFSLVLQYILGMATNLYVEFPNTTNKTRLWEYAWSHTLLAAHIVIGIVLLLSSLILLFRSITAKNQPWIVASTLGFLGILLAGYSGSIFVSTQNDTYSFLMSLGFIIAFAAYFGGMYFSHTSSISSH